jgi:hypothetical protein
MRPELYGALRPSPRCFHWPLVWAIMMSLWAVAIMRRGATEEIWIVLALGTVLFGYGFFIDVADKVWWTTDQIWQRAWDYFSLTPMRHVVQIREVTQVQSALHPANFMPGKPFDRISFISPSDTVTVQISFCRREELEELLRLVQTTRPDAHYDPNVTEFMDGGFTDWWRYR